MKPDRVEVVGRFLALKWEDGAESIIDLEILRRACRCAHCAGEPDVTGAVRRPAQAPTYTATSFELRSMEVVGQYALSIDWVDGHNTGIYSWPMLRELGDQGDA